MDLAKLLERKTQIENALTTLTNNYHITLGQKAEVEVMIAELEKNANEIKVDVEDVLPVE